MLLTKSGELFGFGNNEYGQIDWGNNTTKIIKQPMLIKNDQKIKKIRLGNEFSMVLKRDNSDFEQSFDSEYKIILPKSPNGKKLSKRNLNSEKNITDTNTDTHKSRIPFNYSKLYLFGSNESSQILKNNSFISRLDYKNIRYLFFFFFII